MTETEQELINHNTPYKINFQHALKPVRWSVLEDSTVTFFQNSRNYFRIKQHCNTPFCFSTISSGMPELPCKEYKYGINLKPAYPHITDKNDFS